jgi:lipoate-protein ligase A
VTPQSKEWFLLRSPPAAAAFNMAMDAALLEAAQTINQPVLRFYSWTEPAASFGYFQKYADVERMIAVRPLVRRPTGGGVVPHDADWTYSFVVPPEHPWHAFNALDSYRHMHEWICAAFLMAGISTVVAPGCRKVLPGQCFEGHEKFDVLWHDKKIAGAAQRRNRAGLLIQGSVQPPPINVSRADWENAMRDTATRDFKTRWTDFQLDTALQQRVVELADKVYSQSSYNRRR